ncbi:MAG: glycine oxidase [Candidatus Tokpelaia sp. JSC085]|nr:MAG: glycine oxidase [Candidatus Tokpelaia sp. JSC085]
MKKILIKGAGVGGLTVAYELFTHGAHITIAAPENGPAGSASWYAGGMLAPYCECDNADSIIEKWGVKAIKWWHKVLPELVVRHGTLVVAAPRDNVELDRFAARTTGYEIVSAKELGDLEPDLAGRFQHGLFFASEAHIDPRKALDALIGRLKKGGVAFVAIGENEKDYDLVIDATGRARLQLDGQLRGIRGEMLLVRTTDIHFSRPIRLLHPRIPLYVVPRQKNIFMIGATMIESDNLRPITTRSIMEFLNAAYILHPAFAEAEIVEIGVGVRPAYADNLPHVKRKDKVISINGFYRHGYLLAPEMAIQIKNMVLQNCVQDLL